MLQSESDEEESISAQKVGSPGHLVQSRMCYPLSHPFPDVACMNQTLSHYSNDTAVGRSRYHTTPEESASASAFKTPIKQQSRDSLANRLAFK